MKKEKKGLKTALAVSALGIATICMVSGTYAKYISTATGSDTARVAKFAYTINGGSGDTVTLDLFDTSSDTGILDPISGADKLIAPGSENSVDVKFINLSEVKVKVGYSITETNTGNVPLIYKFGNAYYSSVVPKNTYVKLHKADTAPVQVTGDMTDLATAMAGSASNTLATTNATITIPVKWYWAFEETNAAGDTIVATRDTSDTALGKDGTKTVSLNVTFSVEQLDV